jgi:hypothetical protein
MNFPGRKMMESKSRLAKLPKLIVILAVGLVSLIWIANAQRDQDWLWFLPVFEESAARIHLYREGEQIVLRPGDWGYTEVNAAINETVRHINAKEPLALSLDSQNEYYDRFSAVEVFYSEPAIIHTIHSFPKADKYLLPQSGLYHDPPVIFAGMQQWANYRVGALVMASRDRLDEAVDVIWAAQGKD